MEVVTIKSRKKKKKKDSDDLFDVFAGKKKKKSKDEDMSKKKKKKSKKQKDSKNNDKKKSKKKDSKKNKKTGKSKTKSGLTILVDNKSDAKTILRRHYTAMFCKSILDMIKLNVKINAKADMSVSDKGVERAINIGSSVVRKIADAFTPQKEE